MARKNITTSIEIELIKKIKYLAVDTEKPLNELFEEALKEVSELRSDLARKQAALAMLQRLAA